MTCEWCGKDFVAHKTSTRYCCSRCRNLAYKESKRQERLNAFKKEYERKLSGAEEVDKVEFMTPTEAATLLRIGHTTIYNYINRGVIKVWKLKRKTLIRRADVYELFQNLDADAKVSEVAVKEPINEFYTGREIMEKFHISNSALFEIAKREKWPKVFHLGKNRWSKPHVDRYFASKEPKGNIEEWYTADEIQKKYNKTLSAIYNIVHKNGIPKKKVGAKTFYSKHHFDLAIGAVDEKTPEFYTYAEAMEKYGLTRDQLHHYIKHNNIHRVKRGKFTLIHRADLDKLFTPPQI